MQSLLYALEGNTLSPVERRAVWLYVESLFQVGLEPMFPRTPMTYFLFCHRREIEVVMKSLERYENVTKDKINRDESSGLSLSASKCVELPGPFG